MPNRVAAVDDLVDEGGISEIKEGEPDHLFLACASYESRTLTVAESLSEDYQAEKGIVYVNKEFLKGKGGELTKSNLDNLRTILNGHCEEVNVAQGSWLDPVEQITSLKSELQNRHCHSEEFRITFDTTTFNRESLLVTLTLLYNLHQNISMRILYVSPKAHGEWLSRGHREIRNVLGFAGIHQSNKPTALVILSGFEEDRTLKTIEEFEPAKVLLGIGSPPTDEEFLSRNLRTQEFVLNRQITEEFQFSADDIESTYEVINDIITEYTPEWNIVIAPMSTKLSTIGVWLAARNHPEVQITYTLPGEYNITNYSQDAQDIYFDSVLE